MKKVIHDKSRTVASGKLNTQCRAAAEIFSGALAAVFGERRQALDVYLSGVFRRHRELGSRDRQFVSECIYAAFRFWGLVRHFIPVDRRKDAERGIALDAGELEIVLAAALKLNHIEFAAADFWQQKYHLCNAFPKLPPIANARRLLESVGLEREKLSADDELPGWIAPMLAPGFEVETLKKSLTERPMLWLRMQTDQFPKVVDEFAAAGLTAFAHPRISGAVGIPPGGVNLRSLKSFQKGAFEIQDLASQMIGLVCAPRPGERWLDCCAGAGGKTLQLAALMNGRGTVVAMDIRAYKLEDLKLRARRGGFSNITPRPWDGGKLPSSQKMKFDGVLVDAPCSCSGVWRRNVDGRWSLREAEVAEMAEIQFSILQKAAPAVKHAGHLIYGTCSMFELENRAVVERFLAANPEFELEPFPDPLSGRPADGMLQIDGRRDDCDSMFAARMRRK